jgi:hypothetical protein
VTAHALISARTKRALAFARQNDNANVAIVFGVKQGRAHFFNRAGRK